jgi:hypothetical protein
MGSKSNKKIKKQSRDIKNFNINRLAATYNKTTNAYGGPVTSIR